MIFHSTDSHCDVVSRHTACDVLLTTFKSALFNLFNCCSVINSEAITFLNINLSVFRPHLMTCGLLRQMSHTAWSVSVCWT